MTQMNSIQRLEEDLTRVWSVTEDIDDVLKFVGEDPFFEGLTAEHQDKLMNLLIGIKELSNVKMQAAWNSFEKVTKEYYGKK